MKRRQRKGYAIPGSRRADRLRAEDAARGRLQSRFHDALAASLSRVPNPVGLKRWTIPPDDKIATPYATRQRRLRKRARRIAHESRRRNQ